MRLDSAGRGAAGAGAAGEGPGVCRGARPSPWLQVCVCGEDTTEAKRKHHKTRRWEGSETAQSGDGSCPPAVWPALGRQPSDGIRGIGSVGHLGAVAPLGSERPAKGPGRQELSEARPRRAEEGTVVTLQGLGRPVCK